MAEKTSASEQKMENGKPSWRSNHWLWVGLVVFVSWVISCGAFLFWGTIAYDRLEERIAILGILVLSSVLTAVPLGYLIGRLQCKLQRVQDVAQQQLMTDDLTSASSRRHFLTAAEHAMAEAVRHSQPLSLALLDVDHFKVINDTQGHARGDDVLKQIASTSRQLLPKGVIFARLGGDEFGILLPGIGQEETLRIAESLRERVATALNENSDTRISVSIGVATLGTAIPDLERLLAAADAAMYSAKNAGRNCVRGA